MKLFLLIAVVFASCSSNDAVQQQLAALQAKTDSLEQLTTAQQKETDKKNEINRALTERNMNYRNNWSKFIKVSTNENYSSYGIGGGIYNLEVSVQNDTECLLDEVEVHINFIKSGGDMCDESKDVTITNIKKRTTKTVKVDPSNCGRRVGFEVYSISSNAFHFCYSLYNGVGPGEKVSNDPYFCK